MRSRTGCVRKQTAGMFVELATLFMSFIVDVDCRRLGCSLGYRVFSLVSILQNIVILTTYPKYYTGKKLCPRILSTLVEPN